MSPFALAATCLLVLSAPLAWTLAPTALRRNVVTRGERLCDPCAHVESITCPGVLSAFVGRAGLRASIARSGTLRIGDAVRDAAEDRPAIPRA
jgi:MOSC domain-containing protein YiiM